MVTYTTAAPTSVGNADTFYDAPYDSRRDSASSASTCSVEMGRQQSRGVYSLEHENGREVLRPQAPAQAQMQMRMPSNEAHVQPARWIDLDSNKLNQTDAERLYDPNLSLSGDFVQVHSVDQCQEQHDEEFYEEYDGAAHMYDHDESLAIAHNQDKSSSHSHSHSHWLRRDTFFDDGQHYHHTPDLPRESPLFHRSNMNQRTGSFTLGQSDSNSNSSRPNLDAWSPPAVYDQEQAGLYDAEIYGRPVQRAGFSLLEQAAPAPHPYQGQVEEARYYGQEQAAVYARQPCSTQTFDNSAVGAGVTTLEPNGYLTVDPRDAYAFDNSAPATQVYNRPTSISPAADPYLPATIEADKEAAVAVNVPPSPPSESGLHLSAWLAECVWSLLIHPYRPEKFGEDNTKAEDYYGYRSSSSPVTPSPRNLNYNPYGLQSKPSQAFIDFCHRTLSQTLLSSTAVVLSLWYIRRFAIHAEGGVGGRRFRELLMDSATDREGRGSEEVARRVLVLGLACSNKWLDDNTFTNKSWSDVTQLPLTNINQLEILALGPIAFDLSVDTTLWTKWLYEINSHVSPFVTDSRLVQEAIRQMFVGLDELEHRYDLEVVAPRERCRWAQAENDTLMAPRLHQFAYGQSSPISEPEHPATNPSDSAQPNEYTQVHPPQQQPHPHMLSQKKERSASSVSSSSAYAQTISNFWYNYMASGEETQHYNAFALPPLRNLAVMA